MLKHLRTHWPVIAGIILVLLAFVGIELEWYTYWGHLDTAFHVIGGGIVVWFVLALLQRDLTHLAAWKQLLILISVTILIGVLWEFAEYATRWIRDALPWLYRYFHGGDLTDTLTDLVADMAGALVIVSWALWKERR